MVIGKHHAHRVFRDDGLQLFEGDDADVGRGIRSMWWCRGGNGSTRALTRGPRHRAEPRRYRLRTTLMQPSFLAWKSATSVVNLNSAAAHGGDCVGPRPPAVTFYQPPSELVAEVLPANKFSDSFALRLALCD